MADSAATPPDIRILPGQVCIDTSGAILAEALSLGVRTWGNTRDADATVMLIGTYEQETSLGGLLLSRLPECVVLHGFDQALVEMLGRELVEDRAGQSAVLDRLLDLVVVQALRSILESSPALPPDPSIAAALRARSRSTPSIPGPSSPLEHTSASRERPWRAASASTSESRPSPT